MAGARGRGAGHRPHLRHRLRRAAAGERRRPVRRPPPALPVRLGRRLSRRDLRYQRFADLAVDGVRLRRHRDPARRRGHPPRRGRRGAVRGDRRLGQPRGADPLLAAVGAVHPQRSAAGGGAALLQESRRLRDGGRRRRAGAGKPGSRHRARRHHSRRRRGCGELADSFHRTRSSPDGKPIVGCIRNALTDAGMAVEQIDYINAHGTGTPENDKMEYLGVSTVFGERTTQIPVSSNKSMVGHTLSAAGAVEAVFSLLTLEHQRIPPTITTTCRPGDPVRRGAQHGARRARHRGDVELVRLRRPERG